MDLIRIEQFIGTDSKIIIRIRIRRIIVIIVDVFKLFWQLYIHKEITRH